MRKSKATVTEFTVKSLILFSILTVIQRLPYLEHINKIWMVFVFFLLAVRMLSYAYTFIQILVIFGLLFVHLFALYFTNFPIANFNLLFYFILWVLLYLFFSKSKEKILFILSQADRYIELVLIFWSIIVGISVFIPSCYRDNYFISFTYNSFRLMPAVLIITALSMYMSISRKNSKFDFFLILPTYAAFMNNSRTYFGVYIIFIIIYIYIRCNSKRKFYITMIPVSILIVICILFSGIGDKIVSATYSSDSYFDFWGTVTSGRTVFWKYDIEAFFKLPFLQQFVGNGFNFVYDINEKMFNSRIWAHNDIINLLMNFGYIGVVIYIWSYCILIKSYMPSGNQIPIIVKVLFHCAVFLNSMMNMSYTYLCAMISYPLFLCAISERYE